MTTAPTVMPAEWEPQDAMWIAWPHQREDWPGKFEPIPWVYVEIARRLAESVRVELLIPAERDRARVTKMLADGGADPARIRLHVVPSDRVWLRDSGPIFTHDTDGGLVARGFRFNGWAKYENHKKDARVNARIADIAGVPFAPAVIPAGRGGPERPLVLEGGSIDVNGAGTLLTTRECLLSKVQCRNPGLTAKAYEDRFAECLGIRHVIWLDKGIAGDDTHGHVDDLARFVGPRTVVLVQEDDPADPNHRPLRRNRELLEAARDQDGAKLDIVPLPMPDPVVFEGQRLPASYANFVIAGGTVLVPTFNDPADRVALGTLADLFPDRKVVGIHATDLVWGLGTLHCLSQQQPSPRKPAPLTATPRVK